MARYALSFDIGGTFTDFALFDLASGRPVAYHKVLTDAREPARGVLSGWNDLIAEHGLVPSEVDLAVHSTTLVTNVLIERKGAVTALLTTRGFRDVLEIGIEQLYDIYDLTAPLPLPLIPRERRVEVSERLAADGRVIEPLDPAEVIAVIGELVARGVESIAVAFLHSYRDPRHEQLAERVIAEAYPALAVSLSSRVAPLVGEYERFSTVAADAYVKPKVRRYLNDLSESLRGLGFRHDLLVMLSSGGVAAMETAAAYPIRLLESGPAAGALAASFYGAATGQTEVLGLDMGGTTAKACLIEGGRPDIAQVLEVGRVHRFKPGSGLPVMVPTVDLIEIGAGGGSIAYVNELGLLKVGPRSAASDPGPASYGLGGQEPTVTDANLVLGYLDPGYFLGGRMRLDTEAAERALRGNVAEPLHMDLVAAAWGIHSVVNENMAAAARLHIIEKNRDPRDFALVAFGGAGPAHAAAVGRLIGTRELIFPFGAGVASAIGALVAPLSFAFTRAYVVMLDAIRDAPIAELFAEMEREAGRALVAAGVAPDTVRVRRAADLRFAGQYHELEVPLPGRAFDRDWDEDLRATFLQRYREQYGRELSGLPIEALNWKIVAEGGGTRVQLTPEEATGGDPASARKGTRPVYFPRPQAGYLDCPIYDRYRLAPGMTLVGPAIVEEREATIVLWPGDAARVDGYRNLTVRLPEENE